MSLGNGTIATGIAALSVPGVSIKDITGIPEQVQPRDCPIMFPSPAGWLTGGNGEPSDGPATFGNPSTRYWIFNRTFEYIYLHSSAGVGRGLIDNIPAMATNADAIMQAVTALDLPQIDVQNISISQFGVLTDPAGNNFYGFHLSLQLREKVNA